MTNINVLDLPTKTEKKSRLQLKSKLLATLLILGTVISLSAWAFASPIGSSPDDDFHLASIWCGNGIREGLCEEGTYPSTRFVPEFLPNTPCFAFDEEKSASCQSRLSESQKVALVEVQHGSFSGTYPPVFYSVMGLFASNNFDLSILMMRFVNIFLFAFTLCALWVLLPRELRSNLFWTWAMTITPLGSFLIASNNPSSWALIGVGSSWIALFGFFKRQGKPKFFLGALYLFLVVVAAGSRADAAVYSVIGGLAVSFICWERTRIYLYSLTLVAAGSLIAFLFFANSLQATVVAQGMPDAAIASNPRSQFAVLSFNIIQLPLLWIGALGFNGLGWLDTRMPALVWVACSIALSVVLFSAWKKAGKQLTIVNIALLATLYALPLYVLQKSLAYVGEQVQSRYLLPLIVLFVGISLLSISRNQSWLSAGQKFTLLAMVSVANSLALYIDLKRYVAGLSHGSGFFLESGMLWWWNIPFGPTTVWLIGSVGFALAAYSGSKLLKSPAVRTPSHGQVD